MNENNNCLKLTDFEDQLVKALYEQRKLNTDEEILEITASGLHPISWWINQTDSGSSLFSGAKDALNQALVNARQLLNKAILTNAERKELTDFLKFLSIHEGKVTRNERLKIFMYDNMPWISFIKEAVYQNPYTVVIATWSLMFLNSVILAIFFRSWAVLFTFWLPLFLAVFGFLFILNKDGYFDDKNSVVKNKLSIKTRFAALMPIQVILLVAFLLISTLGQLPIWHNNQTEFVIARDKVIRYLITKEQSILRYPNLWEIIVRGYTTEPIRIPIELEKNKTFDVGKLNRGQLPITYYSLLTTDPNQFTGLNQEALTTEREQLHNSAEQVIKLWCAQYNPDGENASLIQQLNSLVTNNFRIQSGPTFIKWDEETSKSVEKQIQEPKTVTITVTEKISTPMQKLIN